MKDEYTIKKTCPHCGHSFEFKNTSEKVRRKATGYTNEQMASATRIHWRTRIIELLEEINSKLDFFKAKELPLSICYRCGKNKDKFHQTGWDYFYPCPNCDYQIKWHHTSMEEDKHGNGNN